MVATSTLDSEGVHIFAELGQEALLRGSKIDPYKSSGGESFQVLDGKPYASQLTPEPTTVAVADRRVHTRERRVQTGQADDNPDAVPCSRRPVEDHRGTQYRRTRLMRPIVNCSRLRYLSMKFHGGAFRSWN